MDINDIQNLIPQENIYMNEPMNKHTSFKIGGPAECLVKIKTIEQLKSILKYSKENCIDLTIIGNGSNILVSDDGIKGIVAKIEIDNLKIDKQDEIKFSLNDKYILGSCITIICLIIIYIIIKSIKHNKHKKKKGK